MEAVARRMLPKTIPKVPALCTRQIGHLPFPSLGESRNQIKEPIFEESDIGTLHTVAGRIPIWSKPLQTETLDQSDRGANAAEEFLWGRGFSTLPKSGHDDASHLPFSLVAMLLVFTTTWLWSCFLSRSLFLLLLFFPSLPPGTQHFECCCCGSVVSWRCQVKTYCAHDFALRISEADTHPSHPLTLLQAP